MTKITEPGLYAMPLADYVADPCPEPSLSASIAHKLISQSPAHAFLAHHRLSPDAPREESSVMDIGTVAHGILLEGDESRVIVVEADDWRSKAAREKRDAARAEGKIPMLAKNMADVYAMVKAAKQAINDSELAGIFEESVAEQTMCWNEGDENAKIWLRSRPDLLVQARGLIVDFKTTGTQAEAFLWSRGPMLSNGFDIQAALGIRGIRHLFGSVAPKFVFAVIETYPPYAMSFVSLSPMYLAFAEHRLARAMLLWEDSLWTNTWAGYPTRICYCDPPTWSYAEEEGKI